MKKGSLIAIVIAAAAIITIVSGFIAQNTAINYEEEVEKTLSNISVQTTRRATLIPQLVECIKSYNEYEYNVLNDIVEKRTKTFEAAKNLIDTIENPIEYKRTYENMKLQHQDETIEQVLKVIKPVIVIENYPDLKSQKNYENLMNELSTTENLIAQARVAYNTIIARYNTYVRQFPAKPLLKMMGYEIKSFNRFEAETSKAPKDIFN